MTGTKDTATNTEAKSRNRRTKLTAADKRAATKLKGIWEAYKREHGCNQTEFAEGKLGWTQGNFSQYLTGGVPIGQKALLKLCKAFNCEPGDIREEFRDSNLMRRNADLEKALESTLNIIRSMSNGDLSDDMRTAVTEAEEMIAA